MDAFVFDESIDGGVVVVAGVGAKSKKEKKAKGCLVGSARKSLGDISNIQQRPSKQAIQHVDQQFDSLTTRKYLENLTKENVSLMKLLSDKKKELRKLRTDLEIVHQQNSELACANSQMLAEVTSSRDRLRVLQHALGCQNILVKVRKVEEEEKAKRVRNQNTTNEEVGIWCVEPAVSTQVVKEHFSMNRKRQPQNLALGPPIVEAVQNNKKGDYKRRLRRQSAIYETEDKETTEDSFEIKDENKRRLRRQLASAKTEVPQATEDLSESKNQNKRSLRRQSARFKTEEPEVTEETEVTEDICEIKDDSFSVSPLHDDGVHARESTCSLVKYEDGGKSEEEFRRSSIRPLRRAAEKIKSYKETPLNVKMRRPESLSN